MIFCISLTIFFIQCVELVKDYRTWPVTMSMRVVNQQNSGMHFKLTLRSYDRFEYTSLSQANNIPDLY